MKKDGIIDVDKLKDLLYQTALEFFKETPRSKEELFKALCKLKRKHRVSVINNLLFYNYLQNTSKKNEPEEKCPFCALREKEPEMREEFNNKIKEDIELMIYFD